MRYKSDLRPIRQRLSCHGNLHKNRGQRIGRRSNFDFNKTNFVVTALSYLKTKPLPN